MINIFKKFSRGTKIIDPKSNNNSFEMNVMSYIDDKILLQTIVDQSAYLIFKYQQK